MLWCRGNLQLFCPVRMEMLFFESWCFRSCFESRCGLLNEFYFLCTKDCDFGGRLKFGEAALCSLNWSL